MEVHRELWALSQSEPMSESQAEFHRVERISRTTTRQLRSRMILHETAGTLSSCGVANGYEFCSALPCRSLFSRGALARGSQHGIDTKQETARTGMGLQHIGHLKNLQALELDHTRITDKGLEAISLLSKLRRLELHHNAGLSDASVQQLGRLSSLTWMDLHKTQVTPQGASALQELLKRT